MQEDRNLENGFWGLGQTFKFIGKPGLNRSGKEKALKYADVFLRCDVIHPNSGADPGIVHELSRMLGQVRNRRGICAICSICATSRTSRWTIAST